MAQQMSVKLSRSDASPWGFRLQGGKDFGSPLLIQKVNGGSPAERAGLQVGDAIIKVNNTEVFSMRHKEAQDHIVRAGNGFEITVQRGGSTWKPAVAPVGPQPVTPQSAGHIIPVTKTSLAANKPAAAPIGNAHNFSPAPYAQQQQQQQQQQMNGSAMDPVKSIVNKQYNSPVGIYSEETIAETLSAQAEVLAGGVLGVNFKKNERNYDPKNSEVFKMLNEIANEPRTPEPDVSAGYQYFSHSSHAIGGRATSPLPGTPQAERMGTPPGQRMVTFPQHKFATLPLQHKTGSPFQGVKTQPKPAMKPLPQSAMKPLPQSAVKPLPQTSVKPLPKTAPKVVNDNPQCTDCERVIVGAQKPAGAIAAALASRAAAPAPAPASPQPSNFAPMPFHTPRGGPTHVQPSRPVQAPGGFTGVKPSFNAASPMKQPNIPSAPAPAPFITPAKPAPGGGSAPKGGSIAGSSAPVRGRGVLSQPGGPGARQAMCASCHTQIRGPFVTALGKIWCPEHFVCTSAQCRRQLADIGFVEEKGQLYCEYCFEQFIAPGCDKCSKKIKGDCLNAIGKHFHPECFACSYCNKLFGNNPFFLEDGMPYCQADWNELFTTKCFACGFPIEAGDRWVEALNNNYHSQCFNCTSCKKNLEGQSFFAKSGRPFCKAHAR